MAPKLLRKQVNNDVLKETLYNKPNTYGQDTLAAFSQLVMKDELNLADLDSLSPDDIKAISRKLHFKKITKKSNVMLLEEIKHISKVFIAGQG